MTSKNNYIIVCAIILMALTSCTKWLDVQPKTNISEKVLFENEQGFKDAMAGIYVQMANSSLYAKEYTMATMDVLAQHYNVSAATHTYYQTGRYNYLDAGVKSRINQFWNRSYTTIANINNLLAAIEEKKSLFTEDNYNLIKGEAIGLRAFLHFDLFRAFGPIPSLKISEKSIPYLKAFEMKVTPAISGTDFINACIEDIDASIILLENHKGVNYGTADAYKSHTRNHFNYWAANALKARMALYVGDKGTAYSYAQKVIASANLFPFVQRNELISTAPNRTFLSEQLFGVYVPTLRDINEGLFKKAAQQSALTNTDGFIAQLFDASSTDFRRVFLWKTDGSTSELYPIKYWVDDIQTNTLNTRRVPLIRLSEVYYIAAECANNSVEAYTLLNKVLTNRGISALNVNLPSTQLESEIFKEYKKEFYQEGQLFFYYKRKNTIRISGYGKDMSAVEYVMPIPDDEIEFNN